MAEHDNNNPNAPKPPTGSLERKLNELHAERREEYDTSSTRINAGHPGPQRPATRVTPPPPHNEPPRSRYGDYFDEEEEQLKRRKKRNRNILIAILGIVGVILLGVIAWLVVTGMGEERNGEETELVAEDEEMSAKELELQQMLAQSEFENLEKEFSQYEMSQQEIIVNDTLKYQLQQKYDQARLQVEELRAQLRDAANKSAAEIKQLNDQIKTLRELLKHYLEEIDRLNQENKQLRDENQSLRENLGNTQSRLQETQREKEVLNERMTLAEKLNVTGVSMNMLNKKSKIEKKIKNAKQFVINFTIPQNNSTPPGTKTIYAVITTPEGQILDGGGTFPFEGSTVTASTRKQIDYGGEEIGGILMYYDIRNALTPGTYTVQLFCDGYALMARPLEVQFKN